MKQQHKSDIMAAVYETAEGLHVVGILPTETLCEFDALCLTPVQALSASAPETQELRRELENDTQQCC